MVERDHSRSTGNVVMRTYLALAALLLVPGLGKSEISPDALILSLAKKHGHRLISHKAMKISPIEDSLFHTQAWKEYSFKSERALPNQGKERYYFQYTASILTFPDSIAASKRLDSLLIDLSKDDRRLKSQRRGLRIGSQLIYLRTEPTIYYPVLDELHRSYLEKWFSLQLAEAKHSKQDTLLKACSGWICSLYAFTKRGKLEGIEATIVSTKVERAWGKVWRAHSTCGPQCTYDFFYDANSGKSSEMFQDAFAIDSTKNRIALRDSGGFQVACILSCDTKPQKYKLELGRPIGIPKGEFSKKGLSITLQREGAAKDTLIEL